MGSNYCYKVKHQYLKKRKDGSKNIEDYFSKYITKEDSGYYEEIYAISYRLLPTSSLVRGDIGILNDPKWQKAIKLEEKLEEFEQQGLRFVLNEKGDYVVVEDEDTLKDFEMVRICVDTIDEDTRGMLFILRSDGRTMYYNATIIKDNAPEIIEALLEEGVIYKTLAPGDKAKRARKRKEARYDA